MRRFLFLTALFSTTSVFAGGFQYYELGTPVIGTAAVGQAVTNDASSAYFNPASMTLLQTSQYMLGSQLLLPYTNFSTSSRTTISGDDGGNAATLTPGGDFYFVYRPAAQWAFGISLTSPYGGMLTYNEGWVGRYQVQRVQFYSLDLNPTLAYQITDWLAFGAGFTVEYANLHQTVALPLLPLIDGQINIKVANTSASVNFGALIMPRPDIKIGLTYRSQISHKLKGDITFLRIAATPAVTTRITMPQNAIASFAYNLNYQTTLLAELGWAQWSAMKNTVLNVAGFTATTVLNWRDTYRLGLGGQYRFTPALLVQAGASYDSSPTSSSRRTAVLPVDRQIRLGTGLIYNVMPPVKLGFSYEYINLGHANINNTSSNGKLVGSYSRNYANVFQASINVDV